MRVTRTRSATQLLTIGALVAGLIVPLAALAVPAYAATHDTTLVSRATDGAAGNGDSSWSWVPGSSATSADGRYVVFESQADNLSGEDNDSYRNLFVRDRQLGETTLVSRASDGTAANGDSSHPSISADGNYVAFASDAPNLSDQDMDACPDPYWGDLRPCSNVFVRDRQAATTTLVSRATDGAAANNSSHTPTMFPDGTGVAFGSFADNLSTEDVKVCTRATETGDTYTVPCLNNYVWKRQDNSTTYLAAGSDEGISCGASISADGRFAAVETGNVERVDLQTGESTVVSRKNGTDGAPVAGWCPSISADGSVVAFVADNSLIDAGVGTVWHEVFVRDLRAGTTKVISRANPDSPEWNMYSGHPSISADGRFVAFNSQANYLSAFDQDGTSDVFVRDLATDSLTYVSRASGDTGAGGDSGSSVPSISADGRVVAFHSAATNLSAEDNDAYSDVFVRELAPAGDAPPPPPQADLSLSMTASNNAPTVGSEVTFTVALTNAGPDTATGVGVGDWLPGGGLTYVSATASHGTYDPAPGLWWLTSLASGDTATLQLVGKATTSGAKTNTAAVNTAGQADPDSKPSNGVASEDDQASVTITATAPPPNCTSATVKPSADSWIRQSTPSSNYGTGTTLKVDSKPNANARALVRYPLPAVPTGCKVSSAKLRLYTATATSGRTLRATPLAAAWTETAVTWNNRPSTTGTTAYTTSGAGWRHWTLTSQVNAMYTGGNYGLLIRDNSESGSGYLQQFNSRENTTNPPELIVTFAPA